MKKVEGNTGVRLLECINPIKNKWRVRWDVQPGENGSATYMEEEFDHRPTEDEIRSTVITWHNLSLIHISEPTRLVGSEMCIRDRS